MGSSDADSDMTPNLTPRHLAPVMGAANTSLQPWNSRLHTQSPSGGGGPTNYYSNLHEALTGNTHNRPVLRRVFPLKLDDALNKTNRPDMIQEETARTYVSSIKNSSGYNRQQSQAPGAQEVVSTYRSGGADH
jgi:hypothetical protein